MAVADRPLQGTHVLDLGIWRPAPFATQLLAELGASVTKVEPPGGDPMRMFPALYRTLNERKQVVEHDLKDEAGLVAVRRLAADVDVAVEGFRPGVADRLGVGYRALLEVNPRIIYCSISGYGQTGPLVDTPGHDLNYQAYAGFLAARAPRSTRAGIPVGDLAGGTYAAMTICATLAGRGSHDTGTYLDVSMTDVLLSWAGPEIGGAFASSDDPGAAFPGYGTFACADGFVTLGVVSEDAFWVALCDALGLPDRRHLDVAGRAAMGDRLRAELADAIAARPRDQLVDALIGVGVPVAPVLTAREAMRSEAFEPNLGHPVRFTR